MSALVCDHELTQKLRGQDSKLLNKLRRLSGATSASAHIHNEGGFSYLQKAPSTLHNPSP